MESVEYQDHNDGTATLDGETMSLAKAQAWIGMIFEGAKVTIAITPVSAIVYRWPRPMAVNDNTAGEARERL